MTPSEILEAAALVLEPRGAWTQGEMARTITGNAIGPNELNAVCWCAAGAIRKVVGLSWDPAHVAQAFLDRVVPGGATATFNDAKSRRKGDVIAAIHKAADLARSEGL